nr:hypothetical transcript [Hymenolepis microstoma]
MLDTDEVDLLYSRCGSDSTAFLNSSEPPGTPPSTPILPCAGTKNQQRERRHRRSLSEQIFSRAILHSSRSRSCHREEREKGGSEGGGESLSDFPGDESKYKNRIGRAALYYDFSPFEKYQNGTLKRSTSGSTHNTIYLKNVLKRTVKKVLISSRADDDAIAGSSQSDSRVMTREVKNKYKRMSDERKRYHQQRASSAHDYTETSLCWNCKLTIRGAKLKAKYNCCVHVYYAEKLLTKTEFSGETANPVWCKTISFPVNNADEPLQLQLIEKHNIRSDKLIGRAYIYLLRDQTVCSHEAPIKYFSIKKKNSQNLGNICVETCIDFGLLSSNDDDSTMLASPAYSESLDGLGSEVPTSKSIPRPIYKRITHIVSSHVRLPSFNRQKSKVLIRESNPSIVEAASTRADESFFFSPFEVTRRYVENDGVAKPFNIPWNPFFDWPGCYCQDLSIVALKKRYPTHFWQLYIPKIRWPIEFLLPMSRLRLPKSNFVDNLEVGDSVKYSKIVESGFANVYLIGARGLRSIPQVEMMAKNNLEDKSGGIASTVSGFLASSVFGGNSSVSESTMAGPESRGSVVNLGSPGANCTSPETLAATLVALHWAAKSLTLQPSPQVEFAYGNEKKSSSIVKNNSNPNFLEEFDFQVKNGSPRYIRVTVYDRETQPGTGGIPRNSIIGETVIDLNDMPLEITLRMEIQLLKNSSEARILMFVTITGLTTSSGSPLMDRLEVNHPTSSIISSNTGIPRSQSLSSLALSDDGNKLSTREIYSDNEVQFDHKNVSPTLLEHLYEHYSLRKAFKNVQDIGWMRLKICSAMGLGGKAINGKTEIFCVVDMQNTHLRTQSIIKRKNPTWNRSFVLPLSDIHSIMKIAVVEGEKNKNEVIAGLAIHPLRVENGGSKWYALKTPDLRNPTKGSILLEFNLVYSKQLQQRLEHLEIPFKLFGWISQTVEDWLVWKNPINSILALMGYQLIVYYFQPYFIPLVVVFILVKNRLFNRRNVDYVKHESKNSKTPVRLASSLEHKIYKDQYEMLEQYTSNRFRNSELSAQNEKDEIKSYDCEDNKLESTKQLSTSLKDLANLDEYIFSIRNVSGDMPEERDEERKTPTPTPNKSEGKTVKTFLSAYKEKKNRVFEVIEGIASTYERIEGLFNWRIPWLSTLFVITMLIMTATLFLVPFKFIIMLYGLIKFTKKILRPNAPRNNELKDLLSRVPDLIEASPTGEAELCTGEIIRITPDKAYYENCNEKTLYVDYENIVRVLNVGSLIFIDDGLICVRVKEKGADYLDCVIENGGRLGSKKGVNLPGSPVDLPAMSEKDRQDILFAVNNNLDMIFASFIRDAKAIYEMRQLMGERGARIKIIAKIENHQGVKNINEIIDAADGIMVARGDLGIEIPPEKVFLVQKMCFERCNFVGKPCICATQMLESMTYKPRATRAESSDVANAVLDGADCVMLSGESAKGKYPVECVRTMSGICREAESVSSRMRPYNGLQSMTKLPAETNLGTAIAAVEASLSIAARAILCITSSGESSRMLSWHRPLCPILCVTRDPVAARQLNLFWGCIPIIYEGKGADCWSEDVNHRIECGINYGLQIGWRSEPGHTNAVRIIQLGSFENHDVIGFPELKHLKY